MVHQLFPADFTPGGGPPPPGRAHLARQRLRSGNVRFSRGTAFLPLSVLLTCQRPPSAPARWSAAIFLQAEAANEWNSELPDAPHLRPPELGHCRPGGAACLVHLPAFAGALEDTTPPPRPGGGEVGRVKWGRGA